MLIVQQLAIVFLSRNELSRNRNTVTTNTNQTVMHNLNEPTERKAPPIVNVPTNESMNYTVPIYSMMN